MSLSTSMSPSLEPEDDDTRIRRSNEWYGGSRSVPTMSLSISISPSHPVEDGDTIIRISIHVYGGAAAAVILLVTVVMVIVLAYVLQQRSKKAMDKEQTNEYSQVYAGTEQHVYANIYCDQAHTSTFGRKHVWCVISKGAVGGHHNYAMCV